MSFTLRPLEPSDGPALDILLRTEAATTSVAVTTRYRHDVYTTLLAQHPSLFGVVAESPGRDGLAGMATAFLDEVEIEGAMWPCVHLENLKVHHDVRRQGLGRRLAEWRIDEGRRRSGGDPVVMAGVDATNAASLATARRWATQVLGPVRIVIARVRNRPAGGTSLTVRPLEERDVEAIVDGTNAFYAGHNLYPRQDPETLAAAHAPTSLGRPIRHYRVGEAADGSIVAGLSVTERFELMTDHVERVPAPIALLSKVVPMFPPDWVIRMLEVGLVWHRPGHARDAQLVWDAVRFEWRDRATNVVGLTDLEGPLVDVLRTGPSFAPRIRLMVPVRSPVPLDEQRPVYLWR